MKQQLKLILGHRGYPPRATENTLTSARLALEAGADGLEFDVQKAKDAYIVFHDHTLERLSGRPDKVADVDAAVWRHLPVEIPELKDWLRALPRTILLNLELKEETLAPGDATALDAIVRAHYDPENVLISSFEHTLLPPWRELGYRTALLFDQRHIAPGAPSVQALIRRYRPWSVNVPVLYFQNVSRARATLTAFVVRQVYGVKVLVWTVNTEAEMELVWPYCDGLITNETERAVAFRRRQEPE
ncbi:MAG: glycerophosphodiester phosphodiesterase family protein [Spirochaetales bacterium]